MKVKFYLTMAMFYLLACYSEVKAEESLTDEVTIFLTASIINGHRNTKPRSIVKVPVVKYRDRFLLFKEGHEPFFLTVKTGDNIIEEAYVTEQIMQVELPSELSGEILIILTTDNGITYVGSVELDSSQI